MDGPLVNRLFRQEHKPGSHVRIGYPLKASKREAGLKMRYPIAEASKVSGRLPV